MLYLVHRNRDGGGVAIYLRNSLNYTVRDDFTDESLETINAWNYEAESQTIYS
jgi:hypothetical protein